MSDSPSTNRWLPPILFASVSAVVSIAVWYTLDHLGVRVGKLGWPLSHVTWLALMMGISGGVFGRMYQTVWERRVAAKEDPVEDTEPDDELGETSQAPLPAMPVFADFLGIARRQRHSITNTTVDLFDLTTESSDGDGGTTRLTRTIALLSAPGLPPFDLRPKQMHDHILAWAGSPGLEFDARDSGTVDGKELVARFTSAYRIALVSPEAMMSGTADADERSVRRLFTLQVMRIILRRSNWHVQSHAENLACWEGIDALGPKRRDALSKDAVELRTLLLAAFAGEAGEPLAAPTGAASIPRQAARLQATLLGGVLGALIGFFTAGLLQVGEVFGPERFTAIFPLSIVVGVLLGATTGRWLPLRQPLLQKPKDARREKVVGCAVIAGLVGGFFGGAILGIILTEWIDLAIDAHKPRMLLVFGGLGAGTLFGPILLGVATNYLYLWITRSGASSPGNQSDLES